MSARWLSLLASLLLGAPAAFAGNSGVTYQGRILRPDGSPLSGATTQFKLQIRTPDSNNCLMYEELQTLDLRNTSGQFSLTINDGTGSRTDTTSLNLDRIFANRGTFTFNPSTCSAGSAYTPNQSDGRNLVVLFKDETMATWEPIPAQKINYVPFAFDTKQISGFPADSLLRVVDGSGDPLTGVSPLSNAQYTALLDLVNGSSAAYTKAGQLNGVALPTMTSGEVLGWNGTAWVSQAATSGPNSITTTMIQNGAVDGAKLDPAISISTSGTIASAITTTRDFKIYNATNQYVEMVANNAITGTTDVDGHVFYKLTWPAGAASTNGQVLTSDTSGNLTWTTPSSAGITTLTGDVTATGPGSAAATVASVGTSTAANIHSAEVLANAATAANTANMIVKRDGAGGFAAGAVSATSVSSSGAISATGAISGASVAASGVVTGGSLSTTGSVTQGSSVFNDSTLPTPNTVTVQAPASVTSSYVLKWPTSAGGSDEVLKTDASGNLSWSALPTALPPTGTAGGDLTGTYPNPTIAGSAVTTSKINDGAVTTLKLGDKSVTYAKIQDVTTGKLLGRSTAGPGSAEELSIGSGLSLSGGTLSSTNVSSQWTTHGSDISYDGAGNVGIGTTAPSALLDVAGAIRIAGSGSETCDATHYVGGIRYSGGNIQYCDSTSWKTLGVAGAGLTALTGDVTASGTGSVAATVASVGGVTAANVALGANAANAATDANNPSTIVKRDTSGGFAAGAVSATSVSSSGAISATGAINGASVTATGAISGASVTATGAVTGASVKTSSLQLDNGVSLIELVNPSLSAAYTLTLPSGTGTTGQILTTNGLGVTSWSSLPTALPPNGSAGGDLTGTYPNPTIAANAVTYAKIQDVTTGKLLGRSTAGPGSAEELSIGSGLSLSGGTLSSTNVSSQWTTHGSNISYDTVGNVGIGTTAPQGALHVVRGGDNAGVFEVNASTGGQYYTLSLRRRSSSGSPLLANAGGMLEFKTEGFTPGQMPQTGYIVNFWENTQTNDTTSRNSALGFGTMSLGSTFERMRITSGGTVGIGTTSPNGKLDVKGSIVMSGATSGYAGFQPAPAAGSTIWTLPTADGTSGQVLKTDGTGKLGWVTPAGAGVTSVTSANADIGVANTTTTPVLTLNSGTGPGQILKLNASSQIPAVDGSLITNLNAGNIGSGVLPVGRGGTGQSAFAIYSVVGVNNAGNQVAIPGSTLNTMLQWTPTGPQWSSATYPAATTANQLLYSSANNVVGQLATANNGVLTTDGSGVPSIASTLPSAVQGNITQTGTITSGTWNGAAVAASYGGTGQTSYTKGDLLYADSASTLAKLPASTNGYVLTSNGAGVAPSWQAVSVGAAKIDDLTDAIANATSLYMGSNAGVALTSGTYNTAIGIDAGEAITTGGNNTLLGYSAGDGITTQTDNVGVGKFAIYFIKPGVRGNTAVGSSALFNNGAGIGGYNTGIGFEAMKNATGADNTAVGYSALDSAAGNYNVGVGESAGSGSAGNYNIAIGYYSFGNSSSSASENVIIGHNAFFNNGTAQSAANNVVIGGQAAGSNRIRSGGNNVILGYQSAMDITSAGDNVIIGKGTAATLTTGSSNILIGTGVDTPAAGTSNYMNIGNAIYGQLSTGRIGIGTTSPVGILDVQGGTATGTNVPGAPINLKSQAGVGPGGVAGGDVNISTGAGAGGWGYGNIYLDVGVSNPGSLYVAKSWNSAYAPSSAIASSPGPHIRLGNGWSADSNTSLASYYVRNSSTNPQYAYTGAVSVPGAGAYGPALVWGQSTGANAYQERMRIDPSGNVGIGTTSPGYKLDVNGALNATGLYIGGVAVSNAGGDFKKDGSVPMTGTLQLSGQYINGNSTAGTGFTVDNSGRASLTSLSGSVNGILTLANPHTATGSGVSLDFTYGPTVGGGSIASVVESSTDTSMRFSTRGSGVVSEKMRILANGFVGIGTSAPGSRLEIKSSASSSAPLKIVSSDGDDLFSIYEGSSTGGSFILRNGSGTQKIRLDSNGDSYFDGGNVGIGTTAPAFALDVAGTIRASGGVTTLNSTVSANNYATSAYTANGNIAGAVVFAGSNTAASDGAATYLSVQAKNTATNFQASYFGSVSVNGGYIPATIIGQQTDGGGGYIERLRIDPTGNVGIGTTNPASKLEVAGTISSTSGGVRYPDGTTQTTSAVTILQGSATSNFLSGLTRYIGFGFADIGTTESGRQLPLPMAGTLSKFYLNTNSAQGPGGNLVCTIRKNGVDTSLLITIAANAAAGLFSDTSHSVSVAEGDLISIRCVNSSSADSATITAFSAVYRY